MNHWYGSYMICTPQYKMKIWDPLFRKKEESTVKVPKYKTFSFLLWFIYLSWCFYLFNDMLPPHASQLPVGPPRPQRVGSSMQECAWYPDGEWATG